mgnify:CR=1 FL=1
MMPRGNFVPFDSTELTPRFFARLSAFDLECPICGQLIQVGKGKPDNSRYNKVLSLITCYGPGLGRGGHQFLVGIVAWPLRDGPRLKGRPADQRPDKRQLSIIRQWARGVWARTKKHRGQESLNQIEPDISLQEILGETKGT